MLTNQGRIVFVIGGSRSGKSRFALIEASKVPGRKAYIATAEALDKEMKDRIERHRNERPKDWDTIEEPLKIADAIRKTGDYNGVILDCLTLWLSNIMQGDLDAELQIEDFISTLRTRRASLLYIVSNEVGMGIVPENELAREFRDLAGMLNQKVAELSDNVYLVTAGIPLKIK